MSKVLNEIRKAIKNGPMSRYAISKVTGIDQAQLARLMAGQEGLSIASLERLVECLGLEIVIRPQGEKGR